MTNNSLLLEVHELFEKYNNVTTKQLKLNLRNVMTKHDYTPEMVYSVLNLKRNTFYSMLNFKNLQRISLEIIVQMSIKFNIDIEEFLKKEL